MIENCRVRLECLLATSTGIDLRILLLKNPRINCFLKMVSGNVHTTILLFVKGLLASVKGALNGR
jgi:hypothetical protein